MRIILNERHSKLFLCIKFFNQHVYNVMNIVGLLLIKKFFDKKFGMLRIGNSSSLFYVFIIVWPNIYKVSYDFLSKNFLLVINQLCSSRCKHVG